MDYRSQAPLFSTIPQNLLKFMSIESVMLFNHFILCRPFLLLPSVLPSIRVFSGESVQVAKVLELQFQQQSFQRMLRLISSRIDWFDLLAVQRTLKSLLQHHNSKASVLRHSAFFMVQLSYPYVANEKTMALII